MNRGQHLWQGRKLLTYSDAELVEVAQLLAGLLADRTGQRDLVDRALARLPRHELFQQVERMDRALEPFRPITPRLLASSGSSTPTG